MNKQDRELLKDILLSRQEFLGCDEEDREKSMIEYEKINALIKK